MQMARKEYHESTKVLFSEYETFHYKIFGATIYFFGRPQLSYNQNNCLRITSSYRDANSNIFNKIIGTTPR